MGPKGGNVLKPLGKCGNVLESSGTFQNVLEKNEFFSFKERTGPKGGNVRWEYSRTFGKVRECSRKFRNLPDCSSLPGGYIRDGIVLEQ